MNRFQPYHTRERFSVMFHLSSMIVQPYMNKIHDSTENYSYWKNVKMLKDPMSLATYIQLLQELKPRTIIEFGTNEGGTALFFKDILNSFQIPVQIHTFDINEDNVVVDKEPGIKYYKLDVYDIKKFVYDNKNMFENLKGPVLVIEDTHRNVKEILDEINPFLKSGDYIVVEDTLDSNVAIQLDDFMGTREDYLVDSHLCDLWGYNNSWNINSILRKE